MSAAAPRDGAFASYRAQWLAAEPDARVALLFFAALRRDPVQAPLVLEHLLADAAFGAGDASVAVAKLGWWADELRGLGRGAARHPLAPLLDPAAATALAGAAAAAGRVAALESIEQSAALVELTRAFTTPLAIALAAAAGEPAPDPITAEALAAARLLRELPRWRRFAAPARARVPLDLLARHRLSRADLVSAAPPPSAEALAVDLVAILLQRVERAVDVARGIVAARLAAVAVLGRALARRPRALLTDAAIAPHWRSVFALWRTARRLY